MRAYNWRLTNQITATSPSSPCARREASLSPARRRQARDDGAPALPHLLPPHGVIQPLLLHQLVVAAGLDHPPMLQNMDGVGMEHRRQPVRDEDGDHLARRHL